MNRVYFEHVGHLWEPYGQILAISRDKNSFYFKLVILGDVEVGKTSLISCFRGESFQLFYPKTGWSSLQATFLTFFDGLKVFFTDFERPISFNYMKGANCQGFYQNVTGALLVFDCSRPKTAKNLLKQADELLHHITKKIALVVVGNKSDLRAKYPTAITSEKGFHIAETIRKQQKFIDNVPYIETSAKNHKNINTVFQTLWTQLYDKSGDDSNLNDFFSIRKFLNYDSGFNWSIF